jgi:hypothetical protein
MGSVMSEKDPMDQGGPQMRITAVTCVKNEGPFLLEWIAFHRVVGVRDFLFYSNDCSDGTDRLLEGRSDQGIVTHLPNPAQGRNYQMEALRHAAKQDIVTGADWVWVADVDEFPNIHVGDHTLPALIKACGAPQAISLTFQFFANAGVQKFKDLPVIEQFTRTHNPDIWCGELAIEVKTLMRHDFPLKYFGAHRPFFREKLPARKHPRWTDGSGRDVTHKFLVAANPRRIRKFPADGARNFATLHHYALRSLDSYLVKNDRGDENRENRAFDDSYWRERNDDAQEDKSIHRYLPALRAEMDRLKALPGIADLHDDCVRLHREKCAELLAQRPYIRLRRHLRKVPKISDAEQKLRDLLGLDA